MTTADDHRQNLQRSDRRRVALYLLAMPSFFAVLLFLPSGTWVWPNGWLFLLALFVAGTLAALYLRQVNPEIFLARSRIHEGTKRWDRILMGVFFPTVVAILIVAALDDGRFQWSRLPWWACSLGYALLLAGMAGLTWAESVNRFFEPTVRIQSERGHTVIDTGPYAVVRHPGYVAACLLFAGIALSLGSLWALIPAGLACLLLVLRTRWEDRMLRDELAGYKEYTRRVRFRWVPGVW